MKICIAILAIGVQLTSSALTAFGYACQKQAHNYAAKNFIKPYRILRWWVGLIAMFSGIPLTFLALMWADQTLLSTLAPFSILFTLILGRLMLQEKILLKHYISCALMIIGSIVALVFASKSTKKLDLLEIQLRLLSVSSLIGVGTTLIFCGFLMLLSSKIIKDIRARSAFFTESQKKKCLLKEEQLVRVQALSTSTELTDIENATEELIVKRPRTFFKNPGWLNVAVFIYPWFAGLMSGLAALSAKCTIMVYTKFGENYSYPFTYIIPIILVLCALGEVLSLNYGFKYFDTALVVPIFKASIVFHNTMAGGFLLKEFFYYTNLYIWMYSLGIFIIILGILVMLFFKTSRGEERSASEEENDPNSSLIEICDE